MVPGLRLWWRHVWVKNSSRISSYQNLYHHSLIHTVRKLSVYHLIVRTLGEFPSLPLRWSWVVVAVGDWSRLQGVSGQDTARVKAGTGVVFEGRQDRIRPGSRLELESSSRGVRTGYGEGQGWSWNRLRGVSGQDAARVKAGAGVVFEGCQDRIRPGSRLELESSSRGVRAGCGQGQGWSWSRLRGVSGQDAARVKAGAGVVFDVVMSSRGAAAAVERSDGEGSG
ncbi:hypothetical protein RRG08_016845 [Elysia crispata]|uniref:Uncharacterized protein n=1 Tax=Elysia crispata TaxID=231223 RepID=A0AAE0XMH3_9GAST|nr:hypothetical protein RRG08_016845 [Elysia crispata]